VKKATKLTIHEIILIFISLSAVAAAGMLALKIYNPYCCLYIALALTGTLAYILKIKKPSINIKSNYVLIMILAVGIIIRLKPHLYIMGGQDQGTYVNMAKQYTQEGKLYLIDEYRENMTPRQQQYYDERGMYIMPSFEKWNRPESEYSMVFYPVHPALLSMAGSILGMNNSIFLLTIKSTLTLFNIYLITNLLTKNKKTSLIVLLLFTLNPVHVFMSKYPVGETTALFFITTGYYFLLKFLKDKENILYLGSSALAFMAFSLTRMTFFIHIPVILFLSIYNTKTKKEKIILAGYCAINLFILIFSYLYYKTFQWPLFEGLYEKTIGKLLKNYIPTDIPNNLKIIFIFLIIGLVVAGSMWKKIQKPAQKILPYVISVITLIVAFEISNFPKNNYKYLFTKSARYYSRYNIVPERGFDLIKHVPLFSVANYVGHFILICFIIMAAYSIIKGKTKYTAITAITIYFAYVYLSRVKIMRYDYYNSRYCLTEVIPSILLSAGIFLGDLINGKKWQNILGQVCLITTIIYFGVFSAIQIGKFEGADLKFYNQLNKKVTNEDLIVFINEKIYDTKYENNFNDYVIGPLKYYYGHNILVLDNVGKINDQLALSIINKHQKTYYISNISLKDNEKFTNERKITLKYNYFNNSRECNYHNYEFLYTKNVKEFKLPGYLKCKLLPNAYFINERDFYFGEINRGSKTFKRSS